MRIQFLLIKVLYEDMKQLNLFFVFSLWKSNSKNEFFPFLLLCKPEIFLWEVLNIYEIFYNRSFWKFPELSLSVSLLGQYKLVSYWNNDSLKDNAVFIEEFMKEKWTRFFVCLQNLSRIRIQKSAIFSSNAKKSAKAHWMRLSINAFSKIFD